MKRTRRPNIGDYIIEAVPEKHVLKCPQCQGALEWTLAGTARLEPVYVCLGWCGTTWSTFDLAILLRRE